MIISSVKYKGNYCLELTFSDSHVQTVDFSTFLASNHHPDYEKYKDERTFLSYDLVDGNLNWDDYTMIFPINDLYKGAIE